MCSIDHIVLAAPDLPAAVDSIEQRLGVPAAPGGSHAAWGTHNALIGLGPDVYLEIIAPDPARTMPEHPVLFGLDRLSGPRLVAWAARADDLERRVATAAAVGVHLGRTETGSRRRPDGLTLEWRLTDPLVVNGDGLIPFLIDWGRSRHPAADAPAGCALVSLDGEHPDPERIRRMLAALEVDLPVRHASSPALIATIESPAGRLVLR